MLPILDQSRKGWVIKIAKIALGNKTKLFGISCKLLTKNSVHKKKMFPIATLARKITEPLKKRYEPMICEKIYQWLHGYIQPSNLSSALRNPL